MSTRLNNVFMNFDEIRHMHLHYLCSQFGLRMQKIRYLGIKAFQWKIILAISYPTGAPRKGHLKLPSSTDSEMVHHPHTANPSFLQSPKVFSCPSPPQRTWSDNCLWVINNPYNALHYSVLSQVLHPPRCSYHPIRHEESSASSCLATEEQQTSRPQISLSSPGYLYRHLNWAANHMQKKFHTLFFSCFSTNGTLLRVNPRRTFLQVCQS